MFFMKLGFSVQREPINDYNIARCGILQHKQKNPLGRKLSRIDQKELNHSFIQFS